MEVVHERCGGLDVHKKEVVACAITPEGKEIRRFGTMTADLLALGDWLQAKGCTHVAMESTGVYWKPISNLLEGQGLTLRVVNAPPIKAVPGRKADVKDAEWIADLLRHGLLRGSFIPDRPQRELRELVLYRKALIRERASEINRIQKTLEGANIQLAAVASNVLGQSGQAMLEAMVQGTEDPHVLAGLAKGKLQAKRCTLEQALHGLMGPHPRRILETQLAHIDSLDRLIERLNQEIAARMRPFGAILDRLDAIPGMGRATAEQLRAETGQNMSRFPTQAHLAAWAGLAQGSDESAGKRRSGKTRKGNPWLREALVEAARAAARTRSSYLSAQYHRLAARRGAKRAAVAVAHSLIVIIYHMLRDGTSYLDLGPDYFTRRDRERLVRRAVRRIEQLGYKVTLEVA